MANFTKINGAFFRQDDQGQLYAVTDKDTLRGLSIGQLPYNAVENTRGLSFGPVSSPAPTPTPTPVQNPTPAPVANATSGQTPAVDIGSLLKEKLASALTAYKGVTNTADLEARRQALLRQRMTATPYGAPGKGYGGEGAFGTAAGSAALALGAGEEYEPQIQALEKQISSAKQGDTEALNNLTKLFSFAKEAGIVGESKKDTSITEVGGQKVLVDNQTGEIVKKLGPASVGGEGGLTTYQRVSAKNSVIDDFRLDPATKQYTTAAAGWSTLANIDTSKKTSADDIAAIYAFAKIMDPESVVREGEYATVQKYSQSWAQTFGFNAQRILVNKEFLSPDAVKNLQKSAAAKMKPIETAYDNARKTYEERLSEFGGSKKDLPDYGYSKSDKLPSKDIRVKEISTGITGLIEEDEFDPKLYIKI